MLLDNYLIESGKHSEKSNKFLRGIRIYHTTFTTLSLKIGFGKTITDYSPFACIHATIAYIAAHQDD